ncbi:MAG: hypothetical protein C0501_30030, partial [Isosphaera sp.]|nr:hypothetical protein [Isosphaera sp.]
MTTTPTPPAPARPWWRGWADFWFRPADPTTLGFVRVCTGLLVLYVHLAYSVDLQAFFGKHGWYSLALVDRERREAPTYVTPFGDWDDQLVFTRLSDYPHRRQALMGFLRGLPADKGQRAAALALLTRLAPPDPKAAQPDPLDVRQVLEYVRQLSTRQEMENHLRVLAAGADPAAPGAGDLDRNTPPFLRHRDPAVRAAMAAEVRAFWEALPKDVSTQARTYVLDHFVELPAEVRQALVRYMVELPDDPSGREARLAYLEYWNNDPRLAHRTGLNSFSVWFHVTDPTQMALVHAGVLVVIVLFTLGLWTRVTSVLVWVAC